jgi:hypothetical protein
VIHVYLAIILPMGDHVPAQGVSWRFGKEDDAIEARVWGSCVTFKKVVPLVSGVGLISHVLTPQDQLLRAYMYYVTCEGGRIPIYS